MTANQDRRSRFLAALFRWPPTVGQMLVVSVIFNIIAAWALIVAGAILVRDLTDDELRERVELIERKSQELDRLREQAARAIAGAERMRAGDPANWREKGCSTGNFFHDFFSMRCDRARKGEM